MSDKPIGMNEPLTLLIDRELVPALSAVVRRILPGIQATAGTLIDNGNDTMELRLSLEPDVEAPASLAGLEVSDSNFGEFEASGGKFNG